METGRFRTYMSYFVLLLSIFVSIIIQQFFADTVSAWESGCYDNEFRDQCVANSEVFQISMALTILFTIQVLETYVCIHLYDNWWSGKIKNRLAFPLVLLCVCL